MSLNITPFNPLADFVEHEGVFFETEVEKIMSQQDAKAGAETQFIYGSIIGEINRVAAAVIFFTEINAEINLNARAPRLILEIITPDRWRLHTWRPYAGDNCPEPSETALHFACRWQEHIMHYLLDAAVAQGVLSKVINWKTARGVTPLHQAALSERISAEGFRRLIDLGADFTLLTNEKSESVLHFLVKKISYRVVEEISYSSYEKAFYLLHKLTARDNPEWKERAFTGTGLLPDIVNLCWEYYPFLDCRASIKSYSTYFFGVMDYVVGNRETPDRIIPFEEMIERKRLFDLLLISGLPSVWPKRKDVRLNFGYDSAVDFGSRPSPAPAPAPAPAPGPAPASAYVPGPGAGYGPGSGPGSDYKFS